MYRITHEIAKYLATHTKSANIPGIYKDEENPYTPKNIHAIGLIDPVGVMGSDYDYLVECDYPLQTDYMEHIPSVGGIWLYKRRELKIPSEPVSIPRIVIDPSAKDSLEVFDVTDCCIVIPSEVEKLTCPKITVLKRLLELEPDLNKCLENNSKKRSE